MTYRKRQLIVGILYVSLVFVGPFTLLILPEMFMNQENLVEFIQDNMVYIWLWIIGDLILITIELFLSTLLYKIYKVVNEKVSFIAYLSRLGMIIVMFGNVILLVRLLGVSVFTNESAANLLAQHHSGIYLWQFFFFVHLFLLGYMIKDLNKVSRVLGYGLIVGAFGYLFDSFIHFFELTNKSLSAFSAALLGIVAVSEIAFGIYLIVTKKDVTTKD